MNARAAKLYANNDAETGVDALNSGQLIVLIYERVFDNLKLGKHALENGQHGVEVFTKAHDLIQQGLLACLDFKAGAEVAQNLGAIYEWSLREIINARVSHSPSPSATIPEVDLQPSKPPIKARSKNERRKVLKLIFGQNGF